MPTFKACSYLEDFFKDPARIIAQTIDALEPHKDKFDSIAFKGNSGSMVAPAVAVALGKAITLVRKADGNHSSRNVEGLLNCRYIIVDDLIDTGSTVRSIQSDIRQADTWGDEFASSECVGIYLWRDREWHWPDNAGHLFEK